MTAPQDNSRLEKIGLLALAGASVGGLIWIAIDSLKANALDPNAATLLGAIVAGLIAFGKDIVAAIRGYSMSAQLGKVTDQLAASGPAQPLPSDPQLVEVVNEPENPIPVEQKP